jgi:predicted nucleotidyltransferase/HEPN domain-containing protein
MKKSLAHLPLEKRQELKRLKSIILGKAPQTQFIILFGSHARGDWVDDMYHEDGICYTYQSDFDILVITEDKKSPNKEEIWSDIEKAYYKHNRLGTPVEIIRHYINDVNKKLCENHYFFSDIKKEGIMLYDSGKFKLERKRRISPERRLEIALEDFEQWFESAVEFLDATFYEITKKHYKKAAFELHQATERFYAAALMVSVGGKPKIHNLETLGKIIVYYHPEFMKIFPRQTDEEDRLFNLLKDAYIDARYKKDYKITREELEYLAKRVEKLRSAVKETCLNIIKDLRKTCSK